MTDNRLFNFPKRSIWDKLKWWWFATFLAKKIIIWGYSDSFAFSNTFKKHSNCLYPFPGQHPEKGFFVFYYLDLNKKEFESMIVTLVAQKIKFELP